MRTFSYIGIGLAIIILAYLIWIYNRFVRLQNIASQAWSDIDVQLRRRYDLIPSLVETVKGYTGHEQDTFERVTQARSKALTAEQEGSPADAAAAENELAGALRSLFAVAEDYPDLKASENFRDLQHELADIEDTIQSARRFYNSAVRDLNTAIESFPHNMAAVLFGVDQREYFEIEEKEARQPVEVNLDNRKADNANADQ